jgi:hypothetical protein
MKYKTFLAAAGWLAVASFPPMVLETTYAASPAAHDPGGAATPRGATGARSFDEVVSVEDYAALMEREAARWEGPANVDGGRVPGTAAGD